MKHAKRNDRTSRRITFEEALAWRTRQSRHMKWLNAPHQRHGHAVPSNDGPDGFLRYGDVSLRGCTL